MDTNPVCPVCGDAPAAPIARVSAVHGSQAGWWPRQRPWAGVAASLPKSAGNPPWEELLRLAGGSGLAGGSACAGREVRGTQVEFGGGAASSPVNRMEMMLGLGTRPSCPPALLRGCHLRPACPPPPPRAEVIYLLLSGLPPGWFHLPWAPSPLRGAVKATFSLGIGLGPLLLRWRMAGHEASLCPAAFLAQLQRVNPLSPGVTQSRRRTALC